MSFVEPLRLLALLLVGLAVALYVVRLRRGHDYAVRFPALETLAGVVGAVPAWRRHLPAALFALALAALVVAFARPEAEVQVPVARATIMLVNDTSLSMEADDVEPTRLEAARRAAERFLADIPAQLRVGAIAFSTDVQTIQTPTQDREELRAALRSLTALGGTATGDALKAAVDQLGQIKDRPVAIVLLSDGARTVGRDPIDVAREARRKKVPIYTVALGTEDGVVTGPYGDEIAVPPDPETMGRISAISGGRSFSAEEDDQLDEVYESLSARLGTRAEEREVTAWAVGAAIVLLLAAAVGSLRWSGRLP